MKKNLLKRALSLVLCMVLVASYLPAGILPAVAEGTSTLALSKTADPSTKDGWKDYYGTDADQISTDNAGGIWTDKSVFTDASAFSNVTTDSQGNPVSITMANDNDMLIALSAMGSTMTITGQTSTPTDTMLVLDVSGSMNDNNNDVAEELAEAANTTISELLTANPNNRVGVVLYSGPQTQNGSASATDAVLLLPLGRYTTGSDGEYVAYSVSGSGWGTTETISLDSDVRIEGTNTKPSTTSKEVVGATYVQKGVILAMNQFTAANNQITVNGMTRKPIMVLMSDGAPTVTDTDFTNPGSYDLGDGTTGSTNAAQGFVTQLTCAYAKAQIETKYGVDSLFYTIGLGTTGDEVATSVLDPQHSNSGINTFWTSYSNTAVGGTVRVAGNFYNSKNVTKISTPLEQVYVDKYIAVDANTDLAAGLKDAFKTIVADISLQSKYHPTLVGSDADLSGYISFVDKIGTYLSVSDVKGILLHDQLHSGKHLAQNFVEGGGILGTEAEPKAAGTAMMESVRNRLGLGSDEAAISLIRNAYYYGQLSYDANTGKYSNYIGWYANAAGQYLGFYHEGVTVLPEATGNAATDPVYTVKSYGFLGETNPDHGVLETDMMYATVQVRHHIVTNEEEMLLKIPASLLPLITYEVSLDENGQLKDLSRSGATYPFRLLYEVGLDRHINSLNVKEYVSADYLATANSKGEPITVNTDGSINFFTNKFDVDLQVGYGTNNAYSYFNPSHQNDKYYFQAHALVYADENGTLYTGSTAPEAYNGKLYRQHTSYKKVNGQLVTDVHYHELSTEARAAALKTDGENTWYVPENTVYTYTTGYVIDKGSNNHTGTLPYAKLPFVDVYGHNVTDASHYFTIGSTLGNNGKLTLMPATGIKLTKTLADGAAATDADFTFTIENLTNPADNGTYVFSIYADGVAISGSALDFAGGKATVQLKAGQVMYITGLTAGTQYKITETETSKHVAVTANGAAGNSATVTIIDQQMVNADFVNRDRGTGNLMITKEVTHAQDGHTVPDSALLEWFWVKVDLGSAFAGKDVQINDGTATGSWRVQDDGTLNLQVRHGQTIAILDLPEGTQVSVSEITDNMLPHFSYDHINSRDHSGAELDNDGKVTIAENGNATVIVHNNYKPLSTTAKLDVKVTKNFIAESALTQDATFTFQVQAWNDDVDYWVDLANGPVFYYAGLANDKYGGTKERTITDVLKNITYTEAGDYAYRVVEKIPDNKLPGVTYDRTVWAFTVHVTDNNGQLVTTIKDNSKPEPNNTITDTFEVSFENTAHRAPVSIDVVKEVSNTAGNAETPVAGFLFAAYEANADWTLLDETADLTVRSDAVGKARFAATYQQVGSHYFVVKEVNEGKPGWVYDNTEYRIQVAVMDPMNDGNLRAAIIIDKVTYDENGKQNTPERLTGTTTITFKNTYDPTDAQLDLDAAVRKDLQGRALKDSEFTFSVFPDGQASHTTSQNALLTGINRSDGTVDFTGTLGFDKVGTYRYDVVEMINDKPGITYDLRIYDLVVEVTDSGNGVLTASYYYEDVTGPTATFTNTYAATETTYAVSGTKTLTGKALINDEFTFLMTEVANANGGALDGAQSWTTTNTMDGKFSFPAITYTAAGTHYYLVSEKQEATTGGITFDETSFIVTVTVTDNGAGQLVAAGQVNSPDGKIAFTNHYVPAKTSSDIPGTKTLEGKVLGAGDYSFQLYASNDLWQNLGVLGQPVANDADGNFRFPTIEYDTAGTYYYLVSEVNGGQTIDGVTYDDSVFRVQVTVTDDLKGQLHAETVVFDENYIPQIGVQFVNSYAVDGDAALVLEGIKYILDPNRQESTRKLKDGEFTFELYAADENYTISGNPIKTTTNAANGQFSMRLDYTAAEDLGKTYHYVLKEKNAGQKIDGVTYSNESYQLRVRLLDSGDGTMQVSVLCNNAGLLFRMENGVRIAYGMTVVNIYEAEPTSVALNGTKTLTGPNSTASIRELKENDFTFQLYKTDSSFVINGLTPIATAKNGGTANKQFSFAEQSLKTAGNHYFVIKESADNPIGGVTYDGAEYHITVTVTDNGKGQLNVVSTNYQKITAAGASSVGSVSFTNIYDPAAATVELSGTKRLSGKSIAADLFTFQLYKTGSAFDTTGVTPVETKNDANGDYNFDALTFDTEGTYYYVVKELNAGSTIEGTTHDKTEYRLTVKVEDNGNGKLIPTVSVNDANVNVVDNKASVTNMAFVNSYKAAPNKVSFSGTKTLTGIRPLKADDFTFQLYKTGSNFAITGLNPVATTKNGGTDNKQFTFADQPLETAGDHYFVIKESSANPIGGVTYDTSEYRMTVKVTDDGKGQLQIESITGTKNGQPVQQIAFTNTYTTADAHVDISGKKTLEGRSLNSNDAFTFVLQQTDDKFAPLAGTTPAEKVHAADGSFAFDRLTFTTPGTYYYTVTEKAGDPNVGITYDKTVYQITVEVTDDENGKLIPAVSVNNSQAKVAVNGTDATVTDVKFLNTYAAAATDSMDLPGGKTLFGARELKANDFTFQMFEANAQFMIQGAAKQTVTNDENGAFAFRGITFDKAGTYYFVIKESSDNPIKGMTYDPAVYQLTIVVTDNLLGKLEITDAKLQKVTAESTTNANELLFANSYDAEDATLSLSGKKILEGKALTDGEFTFLLQQADDKFVPMTGHGVVPSQTVNKSETFTFDAITYDTVGTYYYVITEVDTANERVTFDESEYHVTVTVTDEGGVLKAVATYEKDGKAENEIVFTNVYTPKPADLPLSFQVRKTVKNIGKEAIGPEGFTFVLEENADSWIDATTDKDGNAKFDLTVTEDMIDETFKLKLYEKNDGKANVTYSTAVYEITVAVSLSNDNKLIADLTVDGKAVDEVNVAFENIYDYTVPATPVTGDSTPVALLFSLLAVSAMALAAAVIFRKKITG